MIETFRLPDLGEGLTESELVQWHVNVGDTVELNQPLAEVETAKAIVELPSPFAGVVSVLHAEPGETIEVGANLVSFETVTDAAARPQTETASDAGAISLTDAEAGPQAREPVPAAPAARQPNLVGYGAPATVGTHPVRRRRAADRQARKNTGLRSSERGLLSGLDGMMSAMYVHHFRQTSVEATAFQRSSDSISTVANSVEVRGSR